MIRALVSLAAVVLVSVACDSSEPVEDYSGFDRYIEACQGAATYIDRMNNGQRDFDRVAAAAAYARLTEQEPEWVTMPAEDQQSVRDGIDAGLRNECDPK